MGDAVHADFRSAGAGRARRTARAVAEGKHRQPAGTAQCDWLTLPIMSNIGR